MEMETKKIKEEIVSKFNIVRLVENKNTTDDDILKYGIYPMQIIVIGIHSGIPKTEKSYRTGQLERAKADFKKVVKKYKR